MKKILKNIVIILIIINICLAFSVISIKSIATEELEIGSSEVQDSVSSIVELEGGWRNDVTVIESSRETETSAKFHNDTNVETGYHILKNSENGLNLSTYEDYTNQIKSINGKITINQVIEFLNNKNFETDAFSTGYYLLTHCPSVYCLKAGTPLARYHGNMWFDHSTINQIDLSDLLQWSPSVSWKSGHGPSDISKYTDYLDNKLEADSLSPSGTGSVDVVSAVEGNLGYEEFIDENSDLSEDSLNNLEVSSDSSKDQMVAGFSFSTPQLTNPPTPTTETGTVRVITSNVKYNNPKWTNIYKIDNGFVDEPYYTNVFAFAASYSFKYQEKYHNGSSGYASERSQLAIWGVVGDPSHDDLVSNNSATTNVNNTYVEANKIEYANPTPENIKNSKLWKAGKTLDEYEELLTSNLSETDKLTKHEIAVKGTNENLLNRPTVSLHANRQSDQLIEQKVGTVEDSTGAILFKEDGKDYYKIGPFKMSDYALAFQKPSNDEFNIANRYSGTELTKYKNMLGGIVDGKVSFKNNSKKIVATLDIGTDVKIVYTDMNGNPTSKGKSIGEKTYISNPSESDNYVYPYPESVFYITVEVSKTNGATYIESMDFAYRQTKADGHGWVITSKYILTAFERMNDNVNSETYFCSTKDPNYQFATASTKSKGGFQTNVTYSWHCNDVSGNTTVQKHQECKCDGKHEGSHTASCPKNCTNKHYYNCGGYCKCQGHSVTGKTGYYRCAHGHTECCKAHWEVIAGYPTQQSGQPLLAVNDAYVEVVKYTISSRVTTRLTTNISIDKYIYDTSHNMADELARESDGDTHISGQTGSNTSLYESEGKARENQANELKQDAPVYVENGDRIGYYIVLKNNETKDVEVKIRDELPENCVLLSVKNANTNEVYEREVDFKMLEPNVIRFHTWIRVNANSEVRIKVTVLVNQLSQITLDQIYENKAFIITNNAGWLSGDKYNINYVRTLNDEVNRPGPVVNLSDMDTTYYHDTINKKIPSSSDWFRFNSYKAEIYKFISKYNAETTLLNNDSNNTAGMKVTDETNAESLIVDKNKSPKSKTYYTRYRYSEKEKENYPLAVEQNDTLEFSIMVVNNSSKQNLDGSDLGDITDSGIGKATQIRPTQINDYLQVGLKMDTEHVTAKIYDKNGNIVTRYGSEDGTVAVTVEPGLTADPGYNGYKFIIGDETILNTGEYIIYTVPVEVEESNMYLGTLSNEATIAVLTNINHNGSVAANYEGDIEKFGRIIKDATTDINEGQETSKEFVRMKDLVISGRVWLDRDKDGVMDVNPSTKRLSTSIDVDTNPSSYIRYTDTYEKAMEGIVVKLYRIEPNNLNNSNPEATLVRTVKTNSEGVYSFGFEENSKNSWRAGTYSIIRGADGTLVATDSSQRIQKATGKNEKTQKYSDNSKLYGYYVEFEYDGVVYKSTEVYSGKSHLLDDGTMNTKDQYLKDSNACEFKDERDAFDKKFEIVGYNHAVEGTNTPSNDIKLDFEKDGHNSYLKVDPTRKMTSRSFVEKNNNGTQFTNYLWLFKQTTDYTKPKTAHTKYINLGLEEREDVDISLVQDVYEVHDTVNGEEMRYWYNQNKFAHNNPMSSPDHDKSTTSAFSQEFYMTGYTGDNSILTPYTFKYYAADYNYRVDNYNIQTVRDYKGTESELNSEVLFRIHVKNNSITNDEPNLTNKDIKVYTGINEIVEYFDDDFVDISYNEDGTLKSLIVKTKDENGYLVNTEYKIADAYFVYKNGTKVPALVDGKYNTENSPKILAPKSIYNEPEDASLFRKTTSDAVGLNGYNTVFIRPNIDGINKVILAEGESCDIIIKFTVSKDSLRGVKLGLKTAIAEISAYSTYYDQNGNKPAGLVDKDSNAGNFGATYNEGNLDGTTIKTYKEDNNGNIKFTGIREGEVDPYLKVYEDDNYLTGIVLGKQNENERCIEGRVWDDARSDKATSENNGQDLSNSIQYIGDGKNGTVDGIANKEADNNAKLNQAFEDKNKEKTDFVVEDVGAKLYEIIRIPTNTYGVAVDSNSEDFAEERIYEESIVVNTDENSSGKTKSQMETRTNADGKYSLKGYLPGEYIVRFTYGDTLSEQMKLFNGQDYKSTTYQNFNGARYAIKEYREKDGAIKEVVVQEGDINDYADRTYLKDDNGNVITDIVGNPKKDTDKVLAILESKGLSDAKDDEIRRLETISYSETLNNNKTLILRGKNSTDPELQKDVTNMNAETVDFLVRAEKYASNKKDLTYKETMAKINNSGRHPIENIDFGLQYRPEQQVSLNKFVKNITVTTSDETGAVKNELINAKFNEFYGVVVSTNPNTGVTSFASYEETDDKGIVNKVVFDVLKETGKDDIKDVKTADVTNALAKYDIIDSVTENSVNNYAKNSDGSYQLIIAGTKLDVQNSTGINNLQYISNDKDSHYENSEQGFVYFNVDNEIMQGAEIKVEYLFTGNNISEIDRVNKNLSILRFKDNILDSEVWSAGQKLETINGNVTFGGKTYSSLKDYYDKDGEFNYRGLYASSINSNAVGSLITRKMEDDILENKVYSGALTARNALFNEYYHYEVASQSPLAARKDNLGQDIIYRTKAKTLGTTTNDYYGRYLGSTYYTGKVSDSDIVAELKVDKILDYVDNNLVFREEENNMDSKERYWSKTLAQDLILGGYVQPTILSYKKEDLNNFFTSIIGIGNDLKGKIYSYDEAKNELNVEEGTILKMIKAIQRYSNSSKMKLYLDKSYSGVELNALHQYQQLLEKGILFDSDGVAYSTNERSNLAVLQDIRTRDKQNDNESDLNNFIVNSDITKYLSPRSSTQEGNYNGSYGTVGIIASKVISAEDDTKDMIYENVGEIIEYSSVTGRVTDLSTTLGNVELSKDRSKDNNSSEFEGSKFESDTASVEKVTLTPPTGRTRRHKIVQNVVKGVSYTGIILIVASMIIGGTFGGMKLYRKRRIK